MFLTIRGVKTEDGGGIYDYLGGLPVRGTLSAGEDPRERANR